MPETPATAEDKGSKTPQESRTTESKTFPSPALQDEDTSTHHPKAAVSFFHEAAHIRPPHPELRSPGGKTCVAVSVFLPVGADRPQTGAASHSCPLLFHQLHQAAQITFLSGDSHKRSTS